jgi:hypothetical protein
MCKAFLPDLSERSCRRYILSYYFCVSVQNLQWFTMAEPVAAQPIGLGVNGQATGPASTFDNLIIKSHFDLMYIIYN